MRKQHLIIFRNIVISIIITVLVMVSLLFLITVVFSNKGESYPQRGKLSEIAVGNSDVLIAGDMVLRYWPEGEIFPDIKMILTELPSDVLNANFEKCNSFERSLICFVQNHNNTIITFSQNSPEKLTSTTGTNSIDFVRVFGVDYIIVSCYTKSGHPMKSNYTKIVYKTESEISDDITQFESLSNYKGDYLITTGMYLYSDSQNAVLIELLWFFTSVLVFKVSYRLVSGKRKNIRQSGDRQSGDSTMSCSKQSDGSMIDKG